MNPPLQHYRRSVRSALSPSLGASFNVCGVHRYKAGEFLLLDIASHASKNVCDRFHRLAAAQKIQSDDALSGLNLRFQTVSFLVSGRAQKLIEMI